MNDTHVKTQQSSET